MSVRISTSKEQPMQASKWLDLQALLDADEMGQLLEDLGNPFLFLTGCVREKNCSEVTKEAFLKSYSDYVQIIKSGALPNEKEFRQLFSVVLTVTKDILYAIPLEGQREILRVAQPGVQMQFHCMGYSTVDSKFRPMAFGSPSIFWGVQFSYPQLYLDLKTHEVFTVNESPQFPNTGLYKALQRWIRQNTIPTPFLVKQHKVNVPMRLGKKCLPWINNHAQLKDMGIEVLV